MMEAKQVKVLILGGCGFIGAYLVNTFRENGPMVVFDVNELIAILRTLVSQQVKVVYKKKRGLDVPAIVLDCTAAEIRFG